MAGAVRSARAAAGPAVGSLPCIPAPLLCLELCGGNSVFQGGSFSNTLSNFWRLAVTLFLPVWKYLTSYIPICSQVGSGLLPVPIHPNQEGFLLHQHSRGRWSQAEKTALSCSICDFPLSQMSAPVQQEGKGVESTLVPGARNFSSHLITQTSHLVKAGCEACQGVCSFRWLIRAQALDCGQLRGPSQHRFPGLCRSKGFKFCTCPRSGMCP